MKKEQPDVVTVVVTQKHIDKGVASEPLKCPIALALHDMGYKGAGVGLVSATLIHGSGAWYDLDKKGRQFVLDFDGLCGCPKAVVPTTLVLKRQQRAT